jgi:hypothetical protein
MSFESIAQELVVIEPESSLSQEVPQLNVEDHLSTPVINVESLEINNPGDVDIIIEDLPGAPQGTVDPELDVSEDDKIEVNDENDLQKPIKQEKWDWESQGPVGFIPWIKCRIEDVPKHSGYDSAGLERAIAYLEKIDAEISRAMRLDLDGELDANKIEEVRCKIDDGLSRLQDRLDKIKKHSKSKRRKRSDIDLNIVKSAQKATGVKGVYVSVPLLISRIARVCINGSISAGHNIEDLFFRQVKKYKLTDREQAEVLQLLEDMGYPIRQDRGYLVDEEVDVTSSDNFDWSSLYAS